MPSGDTNPSLNLFKIPPTDLTTASARFVKGPPLTASITPIQVYVEGQTEFLDLQRSYVELDLGFKTTADANLTSRADDTASMTTPWQWNGMQCNGTLLTEQVDMYHLKAMIQTLLNYDRDDGETILTPAGWRNEIDSPVSFTANGVKSDHADFPNMSSNHQSAIKTAKKMARDDCSGGKRKILIIVPFLDAFHTGKWLVPNTTLEMDFYLNSTELFFKWRSQPTHRGSQIDIR